jgi:hypothetical protein
MSRNDLLVVLTRRNGARRTIKVIDVAEILEHWHAGREAGIDRYLRSFETGTMPEPICGERVKKLALPVIQWV